jgi:hypothetical protein
MDSETKKVLNNTFKGWNDRFEQSMGTDNIGGRMSPGDVTEKKK